MYLRSCSYDEMRYELFDTAAIVKGLIVVLTLDIYQRCDSVVLHLSFDNVSKQDTLNGTASDCNYFKTISKNLF